MSTQAGNNAQPATVDIQQAAVASKLAWHRPQVSKLRIEDTAFAPGSITDGFSGSV